MRNVWEQAGHLLWLRLLRGQHCGQGAAGRRTPLNDTRGGVVAPSARSRRALLRERNPVRSAAMFLTVCAVAAVSACSSSDSKDSDPQASPTPSTIQPTEQADPTAVAKNGAIAAYRAYWTELPKVYAVPAIDGTELKRYTAGEALSKAEASVANLKQSGQILIGAPTLTNPTVTGAALDKKVPSVTISACLDVSQWNLVVQESRKPASLPSNRITKYVVVASLEHWPDGWKVLKDTPQEKQPC